MSRSVKKPYVKDVGCRKRTYWASIRREWKQTIKSQWHDEEMELRLPQEIINDYDYSDYNFYSPRDPRWARK